MKRAKQLLLAKQQAGIGANRKQNQRQMPRRQIELGKGTRVIKRSNVCQPRGALDTPGWLYLSCQAKSDAEKG